MKRILLLNGPNLNLLGTREPDKYGTETLASVTERLKTYAAGKDCSVTAFQSNHEGVLIDRLHESVGEFDGIIYNPGAHAHYSYALRDAIASINVPVVEVHITDTRAREPFRAVDVIEPVCTASVVGKGTDGYLLALDELLEG